MYTVHDLHTGKTQNTNLLQLLTVYVRFKLKKNYLNRAHEHCSGVLIQLNDIKENFI